LLPLHLFVYNRRGYVKRLQWGMIVSVSRRCDIPRYQFDWFMEKIRAGAAESVNPFNRNQVKRIPLVPAREGMNADDGVDAFVFWTRDPRHLLVNVDELTERGFSFYVMVTVTGYPLILEPDMTRTSDVLNVMKDLSEKIGAERVIWRYDPVILTTVTDEDFHRRNFDYLARNLAGFVKRVIISLYDEYNAPKKRFDAMEKSSDFKMLDIGGNIHDLLADIAKIAHANNIEIQSCAGKEDFTLIGIKPGACIDAALLERLFGIKLGGKDKNQRSNCLCCKSTDIGAYNMCEAHCVYCYAT